MEKILLPLTHSHWQSLQFLAIWPFESKFSLKINLILPLSCGLFLTISPNFHSLEFSIFLSGFHQALRPKFGHFSDTMTVWWGGINHDILTFWHLIGGQFDMRKWHHYYVTYDTCAFCLSDIVTGWHHDFMTLRPDCSAWICTSRGTGRFMPTLSATKKLQL